MAGLWPFGLEVLTRRFLGWRTRYGEAKGNGPVLAIATKVLTRRLLRRRTRYGKHQRTFFQPPHHAKSRLAQRKPAL
ncbi:hypothetical protein FD51_GL002484 [Lacticaseibacillus zeae DSM 20178 = KCTC 3804]|uniref:Uncharacterized protein n=1 Tax=Lacticaseibacillus zeae DSM 20178 = KCTC 3804 TaxID=1423816 RepID=A0A0R1ETR1_LACZE|nr:hypothetical protein FD51_GL002484 [Lacticaseibacillus zeae DSM 20178 = KCTC 3804]